MIPEKLRGSQELEKSRLLESILLKFKEIEQRLIRFYQKNNNPEMLAEVLDARNDRRKVYPD